MRTVIDEVRARAANLPVVGITVVDDDSVEGRTLTDLFPDGLMARVGTEANRYFTSDQIRVLIDAARGSTQTMDSLPVDVSSGYPIVSPSNIYPNWAHTATDAQLRQEEETARYIPGQSIPLPQRPDHYRVASGRCACGYTSMFSGDMDEHCVQCDTPITPVNAPAFVTPPAPVDATQFSAGRCDKCGNEGWCRRVLHAQPPRINFAVHADPPVDGPVIVTESWCQECWYRSTGGGSRYPGDCRLGDVRENVAGVPQRMMLCDGCDRADYCTEVVRTMSQGTTRFHLCSRCVELERWGGPPSIFTRP